MGVSDLDGSTYQGIKGAIHYAITFVKLCYDKRILPQALILSRSSVNAFLLHKRGSKELCDKKKDINGDNSPTVPQEKRVVPLLMVWMSRCGGGKIGADSQEDTE